MPHPLCHEAGPPRHHPGLVSDTDNTWAYCYPLRGVYEAIAVAAKIPAARYGTIEVRPVHPSLGV